MNKEEKAFIEPEVVTVGEETTLTLTFTIGEIPIKRGDTVIISVFGRNTFDYFYTSGSLPEEDNIVYVSANCQKGDVEISTKSGSVFRIIKIKPSIDLSSGDKVEIVLAGKKPCFNYTGCKDPEELWKTFSKLPFPFITIAHHSAYPLGGICGTDWSFHSDKFQPLVEIYSKHGSSEFFNNPRPLVSQRKGGFVQDALAKGYKLGITAGSDTHISRPGSNCPEEVEELGYPSGLTASFKSTLFYYIRVTQVDREIAWSSPIWIKI